SKDGIGVENPGGNKDKEKIQNNEYLVLDLGGEVASSDLVLTDFKAGEYAGWRAFDASGSQVGSGSIQGEADKIINATIAPGTNYQYLVFERAATNGKDFLIDGISFTRGGTASGTPDRFDYTLTDSDGDSDTATLQINTVNSIPSVDITDHDPAGGGDEVVYEHGLTSIADTTETVSSSLTLTSPDGIASVTIAGQSFTLAQLAALNTSPVSIDTGEGTLTLTGYDTATGELSYSYTLKAAQAHGAGDLLDSIAVQILDANGDTGSGTLNIRIIDDVPVAHDDLDTVLDAYGYASSQVVTTGNVLTGIDSDSSPDANLVSDTMSADSPTSLTSVSYQGTTKYFTSPDGTDAGGNYIQFDTGGSFLKMYEDGNYTFQITDEAYGGTLYQVGSKTPANMAGLWDKVSLAAFTFGTSYTDASGKLNLAAADGTVDFSSQNGIGVAGTQNGMPAPQQINHDSTTNQSEALVVDFGIEVISAKARVSNIFLDENNGEIGKWEAFGADGTKVGEGIIDINSVAYVSNNVGDASIELLDPSGNTIPFQYLVFTSVAQTTPIPTDSSDYFVRAIDYRPIGELFSYTITDADGDSSTANLFIQSRLPNPTIDPDPIWTPITVPTTWDDNNVGANYVGGSGDQAAASANNQASTMYGDSDTDVTVTGNDTLFGYNQNDTLYGGGGDDQLNGGAGNDTIYGDSIPA
ncbi:MAG: hypothetical protein D6794_04005, partial [Deltaproteobacteria bacterium]